MAKLYFRYGAMGSSKTANAIMVRYNYMERGQKALMLKLGSQMVRYLMELYAPCGRMYVGTGKQGVAFYQRLGFTYDHTIPGFFSHNYPEPIYEEGELLTDMVVLAAKL